MWNSLQPHLADAALNLMRRVTGIIWIGWQFLTKINHIAIAVFPIVEKFEVGDYAVDCGGHDICSDLIPDMPSI